MVKFIRVVRYEGSGIFSVIAQKENNMWVVIDGFGADPYMLLPDMSDVTFFAKRNGMKRVKMVATKKLGEC